LIRITTPDEQVINVVIPPEIMQGEAESIENLRARLTPDSELRTGKAEGVSLRIRQKGDAFLMTIKGNTPDPAVRHEVEFDIPAEIFTQLKAFCPAGVSKVRHEIEHDGHTWEVDVFDGENAGLIMAELENPPESITKPLFVGAEVTQDDRYSNQALAYRPFSGWSEAEKQVATGMVR
jgi:adenylate cyclase